MKILIIEDERLAMEKLVSLIGQIDPLHIIAGRLDSIESSVAWLKTHSVPDVILLDIELADGQSFEIFNLVEVTCPVIFTTSYDEYAIKAFSVNSIDYILKPVKKESLASSFQKLSRLQSIFSQSAIAAPDFKSVFREITKQVLPKEYRQRFLVRHGQRLVSIETGNIAFFYTEDKLNFFRTRDNSKYVVDYTMDELETFVDPKKYFRVSRQFLIAIDSIKNIHNYFNGRILLHLIPETDKEVIISRERVNDFKDWMGR
jgi:two-component system, LytTR family, response regulator LytT